MIIHAQPKQLRLSSSILSGHDSSAVGKNARIGGTIRHIPSMLSASLALMALNVVQWYLQGWDDHRCTAKAVALAEECLVWARSLCRGKECQAGEHNEKSQCAARQRSPCCIQLKHGIMM